MIVDDPDTPWRTRRPFGGAKCISFRGSVDVAASLLFAGALAASLSRAGEKTAAEESDLQKQSRQMAESIKLSTLVDGKRRDLEIAKDPVLRFGDIPRANDKGSLWLWQWQGRPQAVLELYRNPSRSWVHVVHSLAGEGLEGDFGEGAPRWAPHGPGINWNRFENGPVPVERPAARARQIKELAQRFSAHEFWDPNNSRYELRLLVQPVYKYSSPEAGLLEGAVFVLCHETNPEVVLLIEAAKRGDEGPAFRYALARLGHAELHVEFDKQEVWRQERVAQTDAREAYFLTFK